MYILRSRAVIFIPIPLPDKVIHISSCTMLFYKDVLQTVSGAGVGTSVTAHQCGRFPKFHRVFLGRDPGTLKSDIVSKKHPQLICSDLRLSN